MSSYATVSISRRNNLHRLYYRRINHMLSICKFNHLVLESTSMVCYRSLYYVPL